MFNVTTLSPLIDGNSNNNSSERLIKENFDFKRNPGLVFVTIACVCTGLWLLFITFYLSRILAFILTKIINRFYLKEGKFHIGSFSVSLLSGKFMFRDLQYYTGDYSIEVIDGFAHLKWWLHIDAEQLNFYKKLSKDQDVYDMKQCRLAFQLNGLKVHLYNRADVYNNMQNILKCERYGDARKSVTSLDILKGDENERTLTDGSIFPQWRSMFPLVRLDIRSGKIALGNRLLETTLWIHFNKGSAAYSMPDATSSLDFYTHFFQCKCDDLRVLLSKSPGFQGQTTEPPRFMGQGLVVLQTGQAKFLYYQDQPGFVPEEGGADSDPEWGLNVKFTKSVTVNYGPWVDKQRDAIQKYFLPNNFQELPVTKPLEPLQQRLHTGFDVKVDFTNSISLELLFSKHEVTSAIHVCCLEPSSLHYYQPWVVNEYGYTSNIIANLQKVEVNTSIQFRKLLECDLLEVAVNMMVPRMWNQFQHWTCELWLSKTTFHFIYEHKNFFNDLLSDWSTTLPPDIATFVPYEWAFNFYMRDFEMILLVNEHNWIECSNENENGELALCGESLDINFVLPFTNFQPEMVETKLFLRCEILMLRMFVPESNTLRKSIISVARNGNKKPSARSTNTCYISADDLLGEFTDEVDGSANPDELLSKGWRRRTKNHGWIDVWSIPVLILNLCYKYYPVPVESDETRNINRKCELNYQDAKEPCDLKPDIISVTLEAGPSAICIFGFFWKQLFLGVKDNYFGINQLLHEFISNKESEIFPVNVSTVRNDEETQVECDMRQHRPFEANITVVLLDIHAELSMHTKDDMESPQAYTDGITFEMHKTYNETRLQLIVAPISLIIQDAVKRPFDSGHLSKGFLCLSGIQFRGHAMFSDKDIPIGSDTVEYGWLIEFQCGNLSGKITPTQLHLLSQWADTFLLHLSDDENRFKVPARVVHCQHKIDQSECSHGNSEHLCPTEIDVKYKMTRLSVETINLFIVESECTCNIQASPIRFATCNASKELICDGGSLFVNELAVRVFIQQANIDCNSPEHITTSYSNSWVEVGVLGFGPVTVDLSEYYRNDASALEQKGFLMNHDCRTKRLWFLWQPEELRSKLAIERMKSRMCACVGGCNFFGKNTNGVRFFTTQLLDATSETTNRYGSNSLWGGPKKIGESVKEQLMKLSGFIPNTGSRRLSSGKVSKRGSSRRGFSSEIGTDVVDHHSVAGSYASPKQTTDSKIGFGRSRSMIDSRYSLMRRMESDEGSFYSCHSEMNARSSSKKPSFNQSIQSVGSSGSYASAVSSVDDFANFEETDTSPAFQTPICSPVLLSVYTNYMQPLTCQNWRQKIPLGFRKSFSLMNNLKIICPEGCECPSPTLPSFKPSVQGKLPFLIVPQQINEPREEFNKNEKKNRLSSAKNRVYINTKLHEPLTCILTPLIVNVVEKYINSFESLKTTYHPCHLLDFIHSKCIEHSQKKFIEHSIYGALKDYCQSHESESLHTLATESACSVKFEIPAINVLFFQVSSEPYSPLETNSLNGQCGSQFSFDMDVKNVDSTLLALRLTNIDVSFHQSLENKVLKHTVVNLLQKQEAIKSTADLQILENLGSLLNPSFTDATGNFRTLQLQLLHLKGSTDKTSHITEIPSAKSSSSFTVKLGGSLYADNISTVGDNQEECLGNIICEAGMENISVECSLVEAISETLRCTPPSSVINETQDVSNVDITMQSSSENIDASPDRNPYSKLLNSSSSLVSGKNGHEAAKDFCALNIGSDENTEMSDEQISHPECSTRDFVNQTSPGALPLKNKENNMNAITRNIQGSASVEMVWLHLAAPDKLKTVNEVDERDVNLVTVLIPSLNAWVPHTVQLMNAINGLITINKYLKYSVLACFMGQALPEHGRLLKKHFTVSTAEIKSRFLQEEYSSQLISVLRKQMLGHKLTAILNSLKKDHLCPGFDDLERGIKALARQWKCTLIGAEDVENVFASTVQSAKKHVVGRGVLTQKDLQFLLKDQKGSEKSSHNGSNLEEGCHQDVMDRGGIEHAPLIDDENDSESDDDVDDDKKESTKQTKDQSLYVWMSKSPFSSPSSTENSKRDRKSGSFSDKSVRLGILQSPMVSVPTSGVQLADATEVFSALLGVVGLKSTKQNVPSTVQTKTNVTLNSFDIILFNSKNTDMNCEETSSAFHINTLNTFLAFNQNSQHTNDSLREILVSVNAEELEQNINFPLIRLGLQVSETLHVLLEEKKFAEKFSSPNKVKEFFKVSSGMLHENVQLPKCWQNMYNIMNLYISPTKQPRTPTPTKARVEIIKADSVMFSVREEEIKISNQNVNKVCKPPRKTVWTGSLSVKKAKLSAKISGLQLTFDLGQLCLSGYRKNIIGHEGMGAEEITSFSLHFKKSKICLADLLFKLTLLTCKVYASNVLYSMHTKPSAKVKKRVLVTIGPIAVEIPHHPGTLRQVFARFTKKLHKHFTEFDEYRSSSRNPYYHSMDNFDMNSVKDSLISLSTTSLFRVSTNSILISAALLPSLRVEYKINHIAGYGKFNGKIKFLFELPSHSLSFNTKVQVVPLPASAHIQLPAIKVSGHFVKIQNRSEENSSGHGYLSVNVNIGMLEQSLTTDLLNHLIFLQQGFMKEVNDVVRDVEENEPLSLWKNSSMETSPPSSSLLIYSVQTTLECIRVTATTPSFTGVVLKTGVITVELSNQNPTKSVLDSPESGSAFRLYGQAQVTLDLSLGQFTRHPSSSDEKDFCVLSNFKTHLGIANTLRGKSQSIEDENKETIMVTLDRPQLFVMSPGVDKGVLVYLHFKNAYDHWVKQRNVITVEYPTVADHIFNKLPQKPIIEQLSSHLFFQININNIGVCLPLNDPLVAQGASSVFTALEDEPGPALVVTVGETSISGCSSGSFVSTGQFKKFRLHLRDCFDHLSSHWQIDEHDIMNTYSIPEGSYQLCSKTTGSEIEKPKWLMTLIWEMCGVDVHVNLKIGKHLNLLANTLTTIVGDSDVADLSSLAEGKDLEEDAVMLDSFNGTSLDEVDGHDLFQKEPSLEKQLWMQTKRVNQLRRNNASAESISREVKLLQEIENALSVEFFKDVKKRFQRKSKRRGSANQESNKRRLTRQGNVSLPISRSQGNVSLPYTRPASYSSAEDLPFNAMRNYKDSLPDVTDGPSVERPIDIQADKPRSPARVQFSGSTYDMNHVSFDKDNANSSTALDFEFNVVVNIDSGKCTLHADTKENDETDSLSSHRNEDGKPRHRGDSLSASQRSYKSLWNTFSQNSSTSDENAVLLIPGVNSRLNYLSVNLKENFRLVSYDYDADSSTTTSGKQKSKTANVNAVVSIQSLPKEMIVKPALLDFLNSALEPIMSENRTSANDGEGEKSANGSPSVISSGSSLSSFPVNVVVLIRIDPSDIRFSCLPVSRVECLLRIPSLDFAITSRPSPCTTNISSPKKRTKKIEHLEDVDLSSGFCCTVCLSRFSFCVFHPYGKQYSSTSSTPKVESKPISGRTEFLSVHVQFIKFNLFRKHLKTPLLKEDSEDHRTVVKVSALCDIGLAAFNYDMRRLHEILDVPKAWYKRGLMRRLFLGKERTYATSRNNKTGKSSYSEILKTELKISPISNNLLTPKSAVKRTPSSNRRSTTGTSFLGNLMGSPFPLSGSANMSGSRNDIFKFDLSKYKLDESSNSDDNVDGPSKRHEILDEWETSVVVAFNVARVEIAANMGNVMGQAVWSTNDFRTNGCILMNNSGVSTKRLDVAVRQGSLKTRGGVIGGSIEVQDILADIKFTENVEQPPLHAGNISVKLAEVRLDYMGSCIIMASLSLLRMKVEDEWRLALKDNEEEDPVKIYLLCEMAWDELQLIMSRSTSPDLVKMKSKIDEFFNQQHRSSLRALSSLRSWSESSAHILKRASVVEIEEESTSALKYQHWIEQLNNLYKVSLRNLARELPERNIKMGGKLQLDGNFLSLACFHGSNFRSQTWGLFTIKEPKLKFTSEACIIERSCQVYRGMCVQNGIFSLGKKTTDGRRHSSDNMADFMATVRRVSRGRCNPPTLGAPVQEWLIFVNTINVNDLPPSLSAKDEASSSVRKVSFAPKYRYENESEVIFGLPRLILRIITEHDQPTTPANLEFGSSPHLVDTHFLSEFDDSISVSMDGSLFFFLHDLILSYMKENESSLVGLKTAPGKGEKLEGAKSRDLVKAKTKYRDFRSKRWKVEPSVRFLSWAGKQMKAVNIDWVLEKLGFKHAALTIPKWTQRGLMDPLDKSLALLMEKLVQYMKEGTEGEQED